MKILSLSWTTFIRSFKFLKHASGIKLLYLIPIFMYKKNGKKLLILCIDIVYV